MTGYDRSQGQMHFHGELWMIVPKLIDVIPLPVSNLRYNDQFSYELLLHHSRRVIEHVQSTYLDDLEFFPFSFDKRIECCHCFPESCSFHFN